MSSSKVNYREIAVSLGITVSDTATDAKIETAVRKKLGLDKGIKLSTKEANKVEALATKWVYVNPQTDTYPHLSGIKVDLLSADGENISMYVPFKKKIALPQRVINYLEEATMVVAVEQRNAFGLIDTIPQEVPKYTVIPVK